MLSFLPELRRIEKLIIFGNFFKSGGVKKYEICFIFYWFF